MALATLASIVLLTPIATARAHDVAAWEKDRQERFAQFKASHPPQESLIADIKAKTDAAVGNAGKLRGSILDAPSVIWRTTATASVVFDIPIGPRMVVVPAGEFTMGSSASEPGHNPAEAPRHRVRLDRALAVGMFPITYGEYAWFVAQTARTSANRCVTLEAGRFVARAGRDWQEPGFAQTARSPATCITFDDASAYAAWLSKKTGQRYRLLSEAEYEYASRAGSATVHWWGNDPDGACAVANGFDQDAKATSGASLIASPCHDGHVFTAPLDTSKPNPFGLYDTAGNVASWTADCWNEGYAGAPTDGSASAKGDCRSHVVRGGSWASPPADLRAASRSKGAPGQADARIGFRLARDL